MRPSDERGGRSGALKEVAFLLAGAVACALVVLFVWGRGRWTEAPPAPGSDGLSVSENVVPAMTPRPWPSAEELRRLYPYESLADRLADETVAESAPLPPATVKRLDAVEESLRQRWDGRTPSLAKLHSDQVEQFIKQDGFGMSRMIPMTSPSYLELADAPPIPFAYLTALPPGGEGTPVELRQTTGGTGARAVPSLAMLETFHDDGRSDFLTPSGFGHVKDRDHVAGFRPHQFRQMPQVRKPGMPPPQKERWAVRRLELVSLLKHPQPAVYASDHLPRMDDLKKAETRPLSDFEGQALKAIRDGEDLVAEATTERILMLGSLRATKQCLDCHNAHRGDLLGAFSYELRRVP
jgi:hypothetical protein